MADLNALTVARAVGILAAHLPQLTVIAVRDLRTEWAFAPGGSTLWVEDACAGEWSRRALAGLQAMARHHELPLPVQALLRRPASEM